MKTISAVFLSAALVGCASLGTDTSYSDRLALQPGMTAPEALATLGGVRTVDDISSSRTTYATYHHVQVCWSPFSGWEASCSDVYDPYSTTEGPVRLMFVDGELASIDY